MIGLLLRELLLPWPKEILHANKKVIETSSEARCRGRVDGMVIIHGPLEPRGLHDEIVESLQHVFDVKTIYRMNIIIQILSLKPLFCITPAHPRMDWALSGQSSEVMPSTTVDGREHHPS